MFSNRTSQNSNFWMSLLQSNTRPLLAFLALVIWGLSSQVAIAQCDITSPPQPIAITTQLNSSGLSGLSADVMNSQGINSAACPYPFGSVYNFYDAMGTFIGSSTFLSGPVIIFDCSSIGLSPITVFVTIDDDFTPGGNESSQVQLSVTVEDNMNPVVSCPTPPMGSPYGTNYDGKNNDDCRTALLQSASITTETATNAGSFPIPDDGLATSTGVTSSVAIAGIPADAIISDIRLVDVGINHTWVGDLVIELEAPSGEIITVLERPGTTTGSGDSSNSEDTSPYGFNDAAMTSAEVMGAGIGGGEVVCFDDGICEYSPAPEVANTPPASFAQLIEIMAANASDPNGSWNLNVFDGAAGDAGSLESWTLEIDWFPGLAHATVTDNCAGSTLDVNYANPADPNGASITVSGVNPGEPNDYEFYGGTTTVTYTATDASGHTNTCSFDIIVADDEAPMWDDPALDPAISTARKAQIVINSVDMNGRRQLDVVIECQSANFTADFDFWTSLLETSPVFSGYLPTASDNCDMDVEVTLGSSASVDYVCAANSGKTNIKQRVIRRFNATDDNGNTLDDSAPVSDFLLRVFAVDHIAPSFNPATAGVSTPTALAAPAPTPGVGPLAYSGMDLTVNTSDAFNPDPTLCEVDMTAMGAPDMSVTAVDCAMGSITYSWTVNTTVGTAPATLAGAGSDAAQVYPVGTHEITYTAVDDCGQTSTFVFNLVVVENTPPVITGCPMDIAMGTDVGVCEATAQWTNPVATDCSGGITTTASGLHAATMSTILIDLNAGPDGMGGILAEGDFPTGTTTVTYTFTDGVGNSSTCVFDVVITDDENPIITGCADVTINSVCPNATVPSYTGSFNISDNCVGAGATQSPAVGTMLSALTLSNDVPPAGLSDGDQFMITITPTDAAGNMGTPCTITATLMDLDEPIPAGPLVNISSSNTIGADCGSLIVNAPTATDCNGTVIFGVPSVADGVAGPNQYIYLTGFNFVTWTYDDGNGNFATQSQTITVIDDTTNPTVNAGPDRPRDTDPGVCTKTMSIDMTEVFPTIAPYLNGADAPGASEYIDNCGVASITYTLTGATTGGPTIVSATPITFELGVTTVTYIATDGAGNTGSDQMVVTVTDNEDPVMDMACWSATLLIGVTAGDVNTTDCAFTLGNADTSYDPTPTDNCAAPPSKSIIGFTSAGGSTFVPGPNHPNSLAGASFPVSSATGTEVYTIGWSFNDGNGNIIGCFQTITVEDRQAPSITCVDEEAAPGNQVIRGISEDGNPNNCAYTVQGTEFNPTFSDNCGIVSITNDWNGTSTLAGAIFNNNAGTDATYTVVWTVTDAFGNMNTCSMDITIQDDVPPTLSCLPGSIFTLPPSPSGGVLTIDPVGLVNPFFTNDACSGFPSITMFPNTFDCTDATNTPIPVVITATDANGNTAFCNTTVTIQENVAPTAVCQNITVYLDASGNASLIAADLDGGSTDNCGPVTLSASPTTFDCTDLAGPASVTLTVTDMSGNSSTCTALVTVLDTISPVAVCQSVVLNLDASGVGTVTAAQFNGGSTDACGSLTYLINGNLQSAYDCSDVGSQPIILTVTDGSGNSSTCSTNVVVIDNSGPTAMCQNLTVNLGPSGTLTFPASDFDDGSFDNCDPMGATLGYTVNGSSTVTVDCNDIGTNTFTLTVTDLNGNSSTCTSQLTVLPNAVVELTVGSVAGAAGGTIGIPVTVTNFSKVRSLQFSLIVDDPTVASINSITLPSAFSSASTSIALNSITFSWFDPNNAGLDLVDGDLVMTLNVDLIGLEGEMSDILLSDVPTPIEVTQGCGPIPFQTAYVTNDGDVTIDPNTSTVLEGVILTEQGEPVSGVTVTLSGDETGTDITDASGMYGFIVPAGSNVTITPTTNMSPKQGVTSLDLAIIQSHIVNGNVINSPYKLISGNPISTPAFSLNITSADLALIQQVIVILGADFQPNSDSWKFVETSYTFSNPTAPWLEAFPQSTSLTNVNNDRTNLNFVGMKMGDVNDTWPNFSLHGGINDRDLDMSFAVDNQKLVAGQEYRLDFKTKDFNDIMAFQSTLNFDQQALAFLDYETGSLTNFTADKVGLTYLDEGKISLIWYNHEGVTGRDDEMVFSLRFKALTDVADLSDVLALSNGIVDVVAYRSDYSQVGINLEFNSAITTSVNTVAADQFALFQNQPNPFNVQSLISFNLPEATEATLSIMDVSGKVLKVYQNSFAAGYNEISIDRAEISATGVLYYQLDTPKHTATRKMVILE